VYRDGVIVPDRDPGLKPGTEVDFQLARPSSAAERVARRKPAKAAGSDVRAAKSSRRKKAKAGPAATEPIPTIAQIRRTMRTPAARVAALLNSAFGIWKDRPEWKGKSTLEVAAELRRKAMGRSRA